MKLCSALILTTLIAAGQEAGSIGSRLDRIAAFDQGGNPKSISTSGKTTVVVFTSTRCPIAADYLERMTALYREFGPKGVQFVFLNANANEPEAEMEQHAKEHGLPFAVLRDKNNVVADQMNAQYTPESYVIDSTGVLRYHGGIDDSRNPARIRKHTLRDALESVLAGKQVAQPESKAFGCTIKKVKKES